jgi:hypothetical protein
MQKDSERVFGSYVVFFVSVGELEGLEGVSMFGKRVQDWGSGVGSRRVWFVYKLGAWG